MNTYKPNNKTTKINKTITTPQLVLEEIIGLTAKNANGLASSDSNSKFAYIAACVVVLYDVDSCTQSHLMVSNRKPKPLSCIAMSGDGKVIAAGESGEQPSILLWDGETKAILCELKGHQFGVASTSFSPNGRHLVSVGFPRDGYLFLWDWRHQILLTKAKAFLSCSVASSVCLTLDSKYILTAGKDHLKFWKMAKPTTSGGSSRPIPWVMHGKPISLGKFKGCSFIAIAPSNLTDNTRTFTVHGREPSLFYALTDTGTLFILTSGSISKTVKLKVEKCFALSVSRNIVACACSNGIVKLLTVSLKYAGNLCYRENNTTKKRKAEECCGNVKQDELQHLSPIPDAVACRFSTSNKLGKSITGMQFQFGPFILQWLFTMTAAFTYGTFRMSTILSDVAY
ncbi:hypothetical protein Leryth_011647 [Lithospermum erythrorhizon]|nr:hypothetical protein Leryth_011647 [Lithospermum erythrorhizon]